MALNISLPAAFLNRMEQQLGGEFPDFTASYSRKRTYGLRVNISKITPEEFEQICPFEIRPIPWIHGGYFYDEDARPSRCPLYRAGLYYLQDPGAMIPASLLPVEEGDRVLDLCAAPGGKATALAAKLNGTGLLAANDISSSRAKALLRNLELFGSASTLVLNEDPERLAEHFAGYFDKILLDAPCSGEGMFRKDPSLISDWSPEKSAALSRLQKRLIHLAAAMLRPGGMLLYSTCTFSREEDEEVVSDLLRTDPGIRLISPDRYEGFARGITPGLESCVRIYPHRMESEGQFAALLRKDPDPQALPDGHEAGREGRSSNQEAVPARSPKGRKARPEKKKGTGKGDSRSEAVRHITSFFEEIGLKTLSGREFRADALEIRSDKAYYVPASVPEIRGLTFLRNGLYLGELKKNRFEPSQALALALAPGDASSCITLPVPDGRLEAYLSGAPVCIAPEEAPVSSGWCLLCAGKYPLAFGKLVNGQLKNKVPSGWRCVSPQ